jgi:hypothetical protein
MAEPTFTFNEMLTLGCVLVRILRDGCITLGALDDDAWMDVDVEQVELSADEKALVDRALAS